MSFKRNRYTTLIVTSKCVYFAIQQINISALNCVMRSIKSVNTTIGRMNFTAGVVCHPIAVSAVKDCLEERGFENIELAFVNLEGKKQGK